MIKQLREIKDDFFARLLAPKGAGGYIHTRDRPVPIPGQSWNDGNSKVARQHRRYDQQASSSKLKLSMLDLKFRIFRKLSSKAA